MLAAVIGVILVGFILVLYIIHVAGESKPPKSIPENDGSFIGENTVLFYYANWCPSCIEMKKIWEKAKKELTEFNFVEIDTDKQPSPDDVKKVPTIIFRGNRYSNVIDYDTFVEFLSYPENPENTENPETENLENPENDQ